MKIYLWKSLLLIMCVGFSYVNANDIETSTKAETADQTVWNDFMRGHAEFKNFVFPLYEEEFVRLVKEGQSPKTLFIGCSDSRMDPQLMVGARPGDLFVIRTAGNFVPPYNPASDYDGVAATLQYAVEGVHVSNIIVCGHNHCGAIEALFTGTAMNFVKKWLQFGRKAQKTVEMDNLPKAQMYATAEKLSIIIQLENLMTYPFVKKLVDEKKLYLHGWYYQIETGSIDYFDPMTQKFHPLIGLKQEDLQKNH